MISNDFGFKVKLFVFGRKIYVSFLFCQIKIQLKLFWTNNMLIENNKNRIFTVFSDGT